MLLLKITEYSIQGPRDEIGLEIMTEEEKRALETILWWSMLRFRPGERATA